MIEALTNRTHWIFDMDGTLTIAQHDFDAIRDTLGLPYGVPILEALDQLPATESAPLHRRLDTIELAIAKQAQPAEGARDLLDYLSHHNRVVGILTRNNLENIDITLKAAGLFDYFRTDCLLSRHCASPKPLPDGILKLLNQWKTQTKNAVMVGDSIHDLHAGNAAGVTTVYVDPSKRFAFKDDADVCIHQLTDLLNG